MNYLVINQFGMTYTLTEKELSHLYYISIEGEIIHKIDVEPAIKVVDADFPLVVHHLRLEHTSQKLKDLLPKEVLAP